MNNLLRVIDYAKDGLTDSQAIDLCLKEASNIKGEKTIVFDGKDYYIDKAILVSDNTEIIIDGCSILQNDEVFDNVIRGVNVIVDENNPYGYPLEVKPQKNIKIIGKNNAKITGTKKPRIGFHSVLKEEQTMNGDFWGWRTHMISLSRGENIEISGLDLSKTMGWSVAFDFCRNVYVHDLVIHSNVKTGDGVDFRSGCCNCRVENISGFTSDDSVACTAGCPKTRLEYPFSNYLYPSEPYGSLALEENRDIHDIKIRNILTGGVHHGVICLAVRGNKVYNIDIENVLESDEGNRSSSVMIYTGYTGGYNPGDLNNITVKNVAAKTAKYAVELRAEVANVTLENITQLNPEGELIFGLPDDGSVKLIG